MKTISVQLIAVALFVCGVLLCVPLPAQAQTYSMTGNMTTAVYGPTATLLNSGNVLIAGGHIPRSAIAGAELYNPVTGIFSGTGSMNTTRQNHTATLLSNGTVLIVGGANNIGVALATAEIYNPTTGTFTYTGSLHAARAQHTATMLSNGKVLIAGGCCGTNGAPLASAELYDPSTGTFSATGNMTAAREQHTASALANGKILMAGGSSGGNFLATAELYDPSTGAFSATGHMISARIEHTATLMTTGNVLITGGYSGGSAPLSEAEVYNPTTGTFATTGSMHSAREIHTATALNNGQVLIAGGVGTTGALSSSELYSPAAGTFSLTGSLVTAQDYQTATLLSNGSVLIAGGLDGTTVLSSAELYLGSTTGYINPKYIVVGVTYAPPGPSLNTFVSYKTSNLLGSTESISNSFMSGTSTSITLTYSSKLPIVGSGSISGTYASSASQTTKASSSVTLTYQTATGEQTFGTSNYFAPVTNDYDIIWVWLNPVLILTVSPGNIIWNGYGVDGTDQAGMDIVGVPLGYLNGDLGSMPPQYATPFLRSWAANQLPTGQNPALTSADLAQIATSDPFSVNTYGPNFIGNNPPSPETADHRFTSSTCTSSASFDYDQAAPSQAPPIFTCSITYTDTSTQAQEITSTYSQTFSYDASFSGGPFWSKLSEDLKTSTTMSWTTDYQTSITSTTSSNASLSVQGPPCNNQNPGVGPCIPVYDSSGNQPTQFFVYQDNMFGTFMFAPVHYY